MNMGAEERQAALVAPSSADLSTAAPARNAAALPNELLSFRLGAEEYGIDILRVQEIRSFEAPTRIANAPHFIKGVVNLRGVIALGADWIKPAPQMNAAVDAGYIMGMGCVRSGDVERMLILTDMEPLMSSADMGLTDAALH